MATGAVALAMPFQEAWILPVQPTGLQWHRVQK